MKKDKVIAMNKTIKVLGFKTLGALGLITVLMGCSNGGETTEVIKPDPLLEVSEGDISSTSPMGVRKFMNLNGLRYEFKNNGESVELLTTDLGEKLGVLSTEIIFGEDEVVYSDFSTTFALNGEVYALNNYDQDFRVAVQLDGQYYIAESVGGITSEQMNVTQYLETAELSSKVVKAEIFDHMELEVLKTLSKEEALRIIEEISDATVINYSSNDEFQQIAEAQSNGQSYLVKYIFEDGSETKMYVIPSLNYVSIGDYGCIDATLNQNIGDLFSGLQ